MFSHIIEEFLGSSLYQQGNFLKIFWVKFHIIPEMTSHRLLKLKSDVISEIKHCNG